MQWTFNIAKQAKGDDGLNFLAIDILCYLLLYQFLQKFSLISNLFLTSVFKVCVLFILK